MHNVPDRVHERRWFTLATLCIALMVIGIDNTILNVALPSIVRDLHASGSQLQWIVDGYTIAFAGMLLTAGSLGDRLGRKRALIFGLIMFGLMSTLASQAGSATGLILFRVVMGIGGAFIFPTTLSILTNTFRDPKERAKAIGIWAGVSGLGIAVGPLAGGLLVEHFFWGSVFLVNLPVCAIAVVLAVFFVPESRDTSEGRLDPIGAVLSIAGLGVLLYGIIGAPEKGWLATPSMVSIGSGLVLLGAFLWWELRTDHPMLDIRFFKNPRFSAASGTITLTYFALFGSTFLLTQYFQFVLGYSPLKAGFMTAPVALAIMVVSPQAPRLVDRIGTKKVVVLGLVMVAAALLLYSCDTLMSSVTAGLGIRLLFGAGMGFTTAPATESIMGSLPKEKAGVGSAVNDTTRQTGGALGVAVIGSVFASRYHSVVATVAGAPASVNASLHSSIGQALDAAHDSGGPHAQAVVDTARTAFVTSMRLAYTIAAVFVAIAAMVAWRWLPNRAASVDEGGEGGEGLPRDDERIQVADALSLSDA